MERLVEFNTQKRIANAEYYLKCFGLEVILEEKESLHGCYRTIAVWREFDGKKEIYASGKGFGDQALLSGLYEAIEHYIYQNLNLAPLFMGINEIITSHRRLKELYPLAIIYKKSTNVKIKVARFHQIDRYGSYIYYPLAMFSPEEYFFGEFSKLSRYKTNSGFAVGIDQTEAAIHAINELVERDALSQHLKEYFLFGQRSNSFYVDKRTLPEKIKKLIDEIEETLNGTIFLIDVTRHKGLYSFFSFCRIAGKRIPFKGSGASSESDSAVSRALLEVLQHFHLYDTDDALRDLIFEKKLQIIPKYHQLFLCEYENNMKEIPYENKSSKLKDPESLLGYQLEVLSNKNLSAYMLELYSNTNIHCVKIVIPGFDNFQMVHTGVFVLPNNKEESDENNR